MPKLACGCTPDASGFGWCGECVRTLHEKIWREMPAKKRAYDRHFAPNQSRELDATAWVNEGCCSCHIDPPCSYCLSKSEAEANEEIGL